MLSSDRQVREQGRRLEHEADVPRPRRDVRDVLVVEPDAAGARLDQPREHPQGRRLAAARRPEQRDELAVGDVEVELVDGDRRAVALADAGRVGRSTSDQVRPLEVAGAEDPEEQQDGGERDQLHRDGQGRRGRRETGGPDEVEDPQRAPS